MTTVVLALEMLGICAILAAMVLVMAGDGAREQKLMCFFLCGSLAQNVGYLLELTAPTMEAALTAVKVENMGSVFLPLCYCWFIYGYCYEKPPKKFLKALFVINLVTLPFTLFFEHNDLFYSGYQWLETSYGYHYLDLSYGPLYPVAMLTRTILPYLLSFYVLYRAVTLSADKVMRRQYATFLIISALPVAALLTYVLKLTNVFDLTPVVLGLSMATVAILIWSRRNYDFGRVAADAVLDSMADGVVVLDEEKRLVSYNRAAADIFPQLRQVRVGEAVPDPEGTWEDLLDEGMAHTLELDGRVYESHAKQITSDSGRGEGHVILLLDVTDTRNYIDEIMKVRLQAEQANLAKSEFLANMSHEIRTPMNAIVGLSDLIMEESRGRKIYVHAKDIQSAAKNLLTIINDILDLSKVEAGKMELVPVDYHVRGMVGGVVSMMEMAAAQRGLSLQCEYDENMPCGYHGDEGRIRQILINLLNNAVKFTKEGYVRITVRGMPFGGDNQELLIFTVEDTGCGIKEEDQEKIFEDFRQADAQRNRSVEGTGLGLSITKHLIKLMGGTIQLKSEYGVGSTFTVTIPQKIVDDRPLSEAPEPTAQKADRERRFTAPGWRALIVDDNAVNRKVAAGFLKPYAFQLTEAESGPEAVELVRKNRYDMIFMDHMMPGMDGIEATGIIRGECGENGTAPIIVALTANAMEGVREKFLSSGFNDFIAKPLDRRQLSQLLGKWVPKELRETGVGAEDGEELDPDLIHIEGIDAQAVVRYRTGSLADYRELLELYCMDGKRKSALLKEYVEQEDYENYEIEVHALKSASANIGALDLSAKARAHEEAAIRGNVKYIETHLGDLLETYARLLEAIRGFLGAGEREEEQDLPPMDKVELREKAGQALGWLEHFRSRESLEIVEDLLHYKLPGNTAEMLREIQEQLKMYEDDAAEELLRQFVNWLDKEE